MLTGIVQGHVGVRHAVIVVCGLSSSHLNAGQIEFSVTFHHKVGRALRRFGHVLRHLTHAPLAWDKEFPCVLVQAAVEQGKQRGFARAVATYQTDFLPGVEGDGGAVKQHLDAAAQGDIF